MLNCKQEYNYINIVLTVNCVSTAAEYQAPLVCDLLQTESMINDSIAVCQGTVEHGIL